MSESERMPGYRKRSQVPPIASRDSRIAYDLSGHSAVRWQAAPMPERPAPTMSTSVCSVGMVGDYQHSVDKLDVMSVTPATRGRRAQRVTGDDRERAILETAERLLEDRALAEISVDDLARGAGISRPSFYFYFPSKEAVLLTLLDRLVEEARTRQGDVLERIADDPAARLREGLA